ncbi:MAG: hypothetical protein V1660_04150 [archaeon]
MKSLDSILTKKARILLVPAIVSLFVLINKSKEADLPCTEYFRQVGIFYSNVIKNNMNSSQEAMKDITAIREAYSSNPSLVKETQRIIKSDIENEYSEVGGFVALSGKEVRLIPNKSYNETLLEGGRIIEFLKLLSAGHHKKMSRIVSDLTSRMNLQEATSFVYQSNIPSKYFDTYKDLLKNASKKEKKDFLKELNSSNKAGLAKILHEKFTQCKDENEKARFKEDLKRISKNNYFHDFPAKSLMGAKGDIISTFHVHNDGEPPSQIDISNTKNIFNPFPEVVISNSEGGFFSLYYVQKGKVLYIGRYGCEKK